MSKLIKAAIADIITIKSGLFNGGPQDLSPVVRGQLAWDAATRIAGTLRDLLKAHEDRDAVNQWLDADDDRYQSSGRQYMTGYYFTLYPNQMRDERHPFYGATREEAINNAAEWCRKDMAK